MKILEFGNPEDKKLLLIHGFQSPWQIWTDYIARYQEEYHILVPILPGHDPEQEEEFSSFEDCAREIEEYVISRYGAEVYAVYGMSMGGLVAAELWGRGRLHFRKLLFESSPLLAFSGMTTALMMKSYLTMTRKARDRDPAILKKAEGTMVRREQMEDFLTLLDHMSEDNIIRYVKAVGEYQLAKGLPTEGMDIFYYYGGAISELPFRKVARYLERYDPRIQTCSIEKAGHCQISLNRPEDWMTVLDYALLEKQ